MGSDERFHLALMGVGGTGAKGRQKEARPPRSSITCKSATDDGRKGRRKERNDEESREKKRREETER